MGVVDCSAIGFARQCILFLIACGCRPSSSRATVACADSADFCPPVCLTPSGCSLFALCVFLLPVALTLVSFALLPAFRSRQFPGFRIRSRTMATYSTDDVNELKEAGNEVSAAS